MASGFRAKRDIPQLNGWLGEARDSNGDPGVVRLEEVLAGQARAVTDLAIVADPAIPPEPMVNVTLTEQQIRDGMLSPFSLGPLQFTWSVANATSTWGDYAAGEQPFGPGYGILTGAQAAVFGTAIGAWDRLILPNFTNVVETAATRGEIRIAFTNVGMDPATAGYAFQGSNQVPTSKVGDIWLNNSTVGQSFAVGTDDYITLLHEIGHTLGLKHSFEPTVIPAPFEDGRYTVMSYTTATPTFSRGFAPNGGGITTTSARVIVTTPMVLDIAAVQYLYGADPTTDAGATTYNFTQGNTTIFAIYDAGGTDTIDVSAFTRSNIIDLTPGAYSSIGLWTIAEQIAFWQAQFPGFDAFIAGAMTSQAYYEWRDNFGIALNTIIENAIGGSGNDTITGNAVANTLNGGAGNDILNGMGGDDLLIAGSGNDILNGGEGNDGFSFGANFTSADQVNGGAGTNDQIGLQGQYMGATALDLLPGMVAGVEVIAVLAGFDYVISTVEATLAPGTLLTIHGTALGAGDNLTFNGQAETDGGRFIVYGGLGADNLTGGSGDDGFYFGQGRFTAADQVNGGLGSNDQLGLDGNYGTVGGAPFVLSGGNIFGIELVALLQFTGAPLYSYNIATNNALVAAGQTITIWALPTQTGVVFDGSAETDGRFTIFGGSGADRFTGGTGGDSMTGGAGADIFAYTAVNQSTGVNFDRLIGFDDSLDKIDLPGVVGGFAAPSSGTLSLASFDADLAAGVNAALGANQAISFTASGGDMAGRIFGVVDVNGDGDYQAGTDYVFEFVSPVTPIDQLGMFI